jgi:hypothetical protein
MRFDQGVRQQGDNDSAAGKNQEASSDDVSWRQPKEIKTLRNLEACGIPWRARCHG